MANGWSELKDVCAVNEETLEAALKTGGSKRVGGILIGPNTVLGRLEPQAGMIGRERPRIGPDTEREEAPGSPSSGSERVSCL